MKRLFILLLAMLMAFSFVSCDNSGKNPEENAVVPSDDVAYEIMTVIQEVMPTIMMPQEGVEVNGDTSTVKTDITVSNGSIVKTVKAGSTGKKVGDSGIFDVAYIGTDNKPHTIYFEFEYKNPDSEYTYPVFGKVIYNDVHYDLSSLQTV